MAAIKILNKNNAIYIAGKAQPSGVLTAAADGDLITVARDDTNEKIVRSVYYRSIHKEDGTQWGSTAAATVTALNNYIQSDNPDGILDSTDKITSLSGVTSSDFTGKTGYTMIVGSSDESISTSGKLLFTATDIKLGDDLNVQNYSIYTTTPNGDIQFTPNGTGSVNLDGSLKFKRFSTPPAAFEGGMYADDQDNLFLGVSD